MSITVTTQDQLDQALADGAEHIIIDSPADVWLEIRPRAQRDSSRVEAWGSSSVVAWDSSSVMARDSSRVVAGDSSSVEAWGSSSVVARGSSRVEAWDSSSVVAWDSSSVEARDSSRVEAWDSSRVEAWDSSRVEAAATSTVHARHESTVTAGPHVAVHLHSARAAVTGGVVIDMTSLDLTDPHAWCEHHGVTVRDGRALLYKSVDEFLVAGHGYRPTTYTIGRTVAAGDWRDDHECGGGLHASPTPHQARDYCRADEPRYLRISAPVESIRPLGGDKCKAPAWRVEAEVDEWREELTQKAATS